MLEGKEHVPFEDWLFPLFELEVYRLVFLAGVLRRNSSFVRVDTAKFFAFVDFHQGSTAVPGDPGH